MNALKNKFLALLYLIGPKYKKSYSQCGEDIIVSRLLRDMAIDKPFYLDIGANNPVVFSNTYLLYKRGGNGICVEPNPALYKKIMRKRPGDICLEVGLGSQDGSKEFFIMDSDGLSTFSLAEAKSEEQKGRRIIQKIEVPVKTIDWVIDKAAGRTIDFLSIDVEGLDREILESIDFSRLRPKIICMETRSFGADDRSARLAIVEFMGKRDYDLAGSTPVNSIFVDLRANKKI